MNHPIFTIDNDSPHNLIELIYCPEYQSNQEFDVINLSTSDSVVKDMIRRCVRHDGYTVKSINLWEYIYEYNICSHVNYESSQTYTFNNTLISDTMLATYPIIIRKYSHRIIDSKTIPCIPPLSAIKIKRFEIRIHKHAKLCFDTFDESKLNKYSGTRVKIHILLPDHNSDILKKDIIRTVENTLNIVILGKSPIRKKIH